jgi:NAD(P)-dependent dehydrogenase (short-subunit alcohol dehydrogenase family)
MGKLDGRVAIVTGARVGRAISLGLAHEGADVAVVDCESAVCEAWATEIRAVGRRAMACPIDLFTCHAPEVQALVDGVVAELGSVDVLVNSASFNPWSFFLELKEEDFTRALHIGLTSYFLFCQAAGRHMARQRRGTMINCSSVVGFFGSGESTAFGAAKGGSNAMTKAIAMALGAYGIRANALAWGPQSINVQYDQEMVDERLRRLPLGRLGTPEDLVGPAVFLACEDSGWVNAHVLYAEGGYTSAAVTEDKFRPKLV